LRGMSPEFAERFIRRMCLPALALDVDSSTGRSAHC
jgi:hypothetical protein